MFQILSLFEMEKSDCIVCKWAFSLHVSLCVYKGSLVAQLAKNPSAMQEAPFDSRVGKTPGGEVGYPPQYSWAPMALRC